MSESPESAVVSTIWLRTDSQAFLL